MRERRFRTIVCVIHTQNDKRRRSEARDVNNLQKSCLGVWNRPSERAGCGLDYGPPSGVGLSRSALAERFSRYLT